MADTVITPEMKKAIGSEGKKIIVELDKSMIKRFAESIDDPNPLWNDDEYVKKSKYGRLIAPPGFFCASMMTGGDSRPEVPAEHLTRKLDGGGEWEYIKPIGVGDIISGSTKLVDIFEREGKMGKMAFMTFETILKNQKGEIVAKCKGTSIHY